MSPKMLKVAQYRHGKFSADDMASENAGSFPYVYPFCAFDFFFFLGGRLERMTPIVIEVPIRSLVIVWPASLLSVHLYLQ